MKQSLKGMRARARKSVKEYMVKHGIPYSQKNEKILTANLLKSWRGK